MSVNESSKVVTPSEFNKFHTLSPSKVFSNEDYLPSRRLEDGKKGVSTMFFYTFNGQPYLHIQKIFVRLRVQ
jgi:hypothetical protein